MGAVDNYLSLLNAPFGVTSPEELPEGSLQGQVGAAAINNTVKALAGLPKQAIQTSAQDMTHYGDHTKDVASVGPAFEAARALSGVGVPFAEEGAAGIFGGDLGANPEQLQRIFHAEDMVDRGALPNEVWQTTQTYRHPADQKWRFEIPDNNMTLRHFPNEEGTTSISSVASMVNHPQLLKPYPQLGNLTLRMTNDHSVPTGTGMFEYKTTPLQSGNQYLSGTVHVNAPNVDVARNVLAHELQHGVQALEGFQNGTDPEYLSSLIQEGLRRNPALLRGLSLDHTKQDVINQAYPFYHIVAGEVEPRNVQARLDWSPQKRASIAPWYSQDVPFSNQLKIDPVTGMLKALRDK